MNHREWARTVIHWIIGVALAITIRTLSQVPGFGFLKSRNAAGRPW
jgi:hypothetical protein